LFLLNVVHDSCGGALDAPQLAARVRRRRFTSIAPDRDMKSQSAALIPI